MNIYTIIYVFMSIILNVFLTFYLNKRLDKLNDYTKLRQLNFNEPKIYSEMIYCYKQEYIVRIIKHISDLVAISMVILILNCILIYMSKELILFYFLLIPILYNIFIIFITVKKYKKDLKKYKNQLHSKYLMDYSNFDIELDKNMPEILKGFEEIYKKVQNADEENLDYKVDIKIMKEVYQIFLDKKANIYNLTPNQLFSIIVSDLTILQNIKNIDKTLNR